MYHTQKELTKFEFPGQLLDTNATLRRKSMLEKASILQQQINNNYQLYQTIDHAVCVDNESSFIPLIYRILSIYHPDPYLILIEQTLVYSVILSSYVATYTDHITLLFSSSTLLSTHPDYPTRTQDDSGKRSKSTINDIQPTQRYAITTNRNHRRLIINSYVFCVLRRIFINSIPYE